MPHFDIGAFREARRKLPLAPYENLTSTEPKSSLLKAKRIIVDGWIRQGYPSVKLMEYIPWEESNQINRSWCFQLHCWKMLHDLLMAYSLTMDQDYLSPSLHVARDWMHHYPSFDVDSVFAWYDMAVGLRCYRLAYLLDVAARSEKVSDDDIALMLDSLELHAIYLADDTNIVFHNNHGFYQISGQMALAARFPELRDMQFVEQATDRLYRILSLQFSEEGIHREHSPDYHRMVLDTLKGLLDSGLFSDAKIRDLADRIETNLAWFILPNGYLVNFGDSDYRQMNRGLSFASKWTSSAMQFMASGGEIGSPPNSRIGAFPASGFFVARDRWPSSKTEFERGSYLAQTLCFHSRSHKHCDDLSFVWYDRSHEILVDSGRYGYLQKTVPGSELHKQGFWYADPNRIYVESTRAHNTIEIDRKDSSRKGAKPYGSALLRYGETKSNLIFTEAHVCHFKTIHHERVLILHPEHWLLVFDHVHDELDVDHEFLQWFHFAPSLVPHTEDQQLVLQVGRSPQPLRVASLLPTTRLSEIFLGEKEPRYQGWWSPKERIMVPNPAIAFDHHRSTTATFATLFAFCQRIVPNFQQSTIDASGREISLVWHTEQGESRLNINRPEEGEMVVSHLCANDSGTPTS